MKQKRAVMLVASDNIKKDRQRLIDKGYKRGYEAASLLYQDYILELENLIKKSSARKEVYNET